MDQFQAVRRQSVLDLAARTELGQLVASDDVVLGAGSLQQAAVEVPLSERYGWRRLR